jgi:hypothetical protein
MVLFFELDTAIGTIYKNSGVVYSNVPKQVVPAQSNLRTVESVFDAS